jgi:glycosyltransferase involved in cell wall biosynthesis
MRGGEKVLEQLLRMYPQAEIFTHVYRPDRVSPLIRRHKVHTTRVSRLPMASRMYQKYLSFMPRALEEIDLSGFDLVISSEAGPAKGVIAPVDAPHVCYCHSPMRYLWDQYNIYRDNAGFLTRQAMPWMVGPLRDWDVVSAQRVDAIAANSRHVARRIEKYWRRDSQVIHPPVAVQEFAPVPPEDRGGFYLWAGELAPYKRPDIAVEAFTRMGKPLVVIGGPGKAERKLARAAGENIRFLGHVGFDKLRRYLSACRGLIFPGEEDFGILPVEAMASGRPVIAYGRGGALDTVVDGKTGILFDEQSVEGLIGAVERFEAEGMEAADPAMLLRHAAQFNEARFRSEFAAYLSAAGARVPVDGMQICAE